MTAATPAITPAPRAGLIRDLFQRQPVLAALGLGYLAALVPALAAVGIDARTLDGAEVWVKPAKFLLSLSVFCLTTAWLFGCVAPERRRGPTAQAITWIIVATSLFEMIYIALQASR